MNGKRIAYREESEMRTHFSVGTYINLYDDDKEIWVMINESNDVTDQMILEAEEIIKMYFEKMELTNMREALEEIFEMGVQIFIDGLQMG